MLKIVLADDHKIVRKGLKALLSSEPDFRIVGEAENGLEALEQVEKLKPDVLVLDLLMPGMNGLEVTRTLCRQPCFTKIVILSMHSSEAYVMEALRLGARAYILKESPPEELITGIRQAAAGHLYLCSPLTGKAANAYAFLDDITTAGNCERLTRREEEIWQMAERGISNKDIAEKLGISIRTVETHRNNLSHKQNLRSFT
jgi:two-component system, NarL family, response regulator NreC